MEEKEFRWLVDEAFEKIGKAFDAIDPDLAEFEFSQGAATITYSDGSKCILSTQPSVRQIWLAAASKGLAFHFGYDGADASWLDDKGKGIELYACVRNLTMDAAHVKISF